jgi:hypothetical protein
MATDVQIIFDCADPAGLARFWAEALYYELLPGLVRRAFFVELGIKSGEARRKKAAK